LFGALDFAIDYVGRSVEFDADLMRAKLSEADAKHSLTAKITCN
jgi:hypothetical protein